nr:branched-chain amino acid ABC transporter permease [Alphaproteobacteria bacterium]
MTRRELQGLLIGVVVLSLAALLPLLDTGYALSLGVTIAMYVVLTTSWTLFSGPTHYISLATAAFFGLGMYVVGGGLELLPFHALVAIA